MTERGPLTPPKRRSPPGHVHGCRAQYLAGPYESSARRRLDAGVRTRHPRFPRSSRFPIARAERVADQNGAGGGGVGRVRRIRSIPETHGGPVPVGHFIREERPRRRRAGSLRERSASGVPTTRSAFGPNTFHRPSTSRTAGFVVSVFVVSVMGCLRAFEVADHGRNQCCGRGRMFCQMCLISRYSSSPVGPSSRPTPDCLKPPHSACGTYGW
jgi:hypothetical protein